MHLIGGCRGGGGEGGLLEEFAAFHDLPPSDELNLDRE